MKILILAGGSGKRLRPYTRPDLPKPLLTFGYKDSLLQQTIERFEKHTARDNIFLLTSSEALEAIRNHLPHYHANIYAEPATKNTAPAVVWWLKKLLASGRITEQETLLLSPADHYFADEEALLRTIDAAEKSLTTIAVFGITPQSAETAYGYIRAASLASIAPVETFIEKPDIQTAESLIQEERIYWNSGLLLFRVDRFIEELKNHAPIFYQFLRGERHFDTLPSVSIDCALMERSQTMQVAKLSTAWSDLGTWEGVYAAFPKDRNNNVMLGTIEATSCTDCLFFTTQRKLTAHKLHNLSIIDTGDEVCVLQKNGGAS